MHGMIEQNGRQLLGLGGSVRKCSAMGRGLKMEVFRLSALRERRGFFRAAMFASPDS